MTAEIITFALDATRKWTKSAACAKRLVQMYPSDGDEKGIRAAKEVCESCPVRLLCLDEAMERGEPWGIWGGMTADERRAMRRNAARRGRGRRNVAEPPGPVTDRDVGDLL